MPLGSQQTPQKTGPSTDPVPPPPPEIAAAPSSVAPPASGDAEPAAGETAGPSPQDTTEVAPAAEEEPAAAPTAAEPQRVRLLIGLAVAAVLLIAASTVLAVGAFTARSSGPQANQAFVDNAATAEVVGQVTNAMITVYSYDYTNLPANEAAAKQVITGRFAGEFERVFGPVKQLAPQEQAVLKSVVPAAAVSLLQGDRARLLMMVDQSGTRGPDKQPTGATARLVVDAVNVGGRWKISEVTPE